MGLEAAETTFRHRYVERSIDALDRELRDSRVRRALGVVSTEMTALARSLLPADPVDGHLTMSSDFRDNDLVPVIARRPGESLAAADEYSLQNSRQKRATLDKFTSWQPIRHSAEELYEALFHDVEEDVPLTTDRLDETSSAVTTVFGRYITAEELSTYFAAAPTKGLAFVLGRPSVTVRVMEEKRHTPPDSLLHELAHIRRHNMSPVIVAHSQRSWDMATLRDELEAYHYGFASASFRYNEKPKLFTPEHWDAGVMQIAVEVFRTDYVDRFGDPNDPYAPSGGLLQFLASKGCHNILHMSLDFDETEKRIRNEAPPAFKWLYD